MKIASAKPDDNPPANSAITPPTSKISPTATGVMTAKSEGKIISRCAPAVAIRTQRA